MYSLPYITYTCVHVIHTVTSPTLSQLHTLTPTPPTNTRTQPHLHEIVNRSMSLANTASEPCNYFLLLRALFRSIGGGSHEQLYQEFLPLLSDLLQGEWVWS